MPPSSPPQVIDLFPADYSEGELAAPETAAPPASGPAIYYYATPPRKVVLAERNRALFALKPGEAFVVDINQRSIHTWLKPRQGIGGREFTTRKIDEERTEVCRVV